MKKNGKVIRMLSAALCAVLVFGMLPVSFAESVFTLGDVNSDGAVDARDIYVIKSNIENNVRFYCSQGDILFDGKVNARDCLYLKAYFAGCLSLEKYSEERETVPLVPDGIFSDPVTDEINGFLIKEGKIAEDYDGHNYCMIGSVSTFDPAEQFAVYQMEHMAFPYVQRDINNIAYEIMESFPEDSAEYAECKSIRSSLSSSFRALRQKYGAFSADGFPEETVRTLTGDDNWKTFAAGMARMTKIAEANGLAGMFTCGMSPYDTYAVAKRCFEYYKGKTPETVTWGTGDTAVSFTVGDTGTARFEELFRALAGSGFDVWVCTDTECEILEALLDVYGLHGYCKGIMGMTPERTADAKNTCRFETENNYPKRAAASGCWLTEYTPLGVSMAETAHKVTAADRISAYYGKGPSACFDTDDGLCTRFSDTKLSVRLCAEDLKNSVTVTPATAEPLISYPESARKKNVEPVDETVKLSVFSLNVRCGDDPDGHSIGERRPRIKSEVTASDADVIGFQEVVPQWLDIIYEDYGAEYEIYNLWRDTQELESSPILWKRSRFECLEKGAFWLSDNPDHMSDGYDPVKRACLFVRLRDLETGKEFIAMNTHVGFIETNQKKSCEVITEYAEKISSLPTFIVGDFNLQPGTLGYNEMTAHFTDVNRATVNDPGETFHGYYHGYEPTELVDYCFEYGMTPVSSEVMRETFDGKYASDHYALRFALEY